MSFKPLNSEFEKEISDLSDVKRLLCVIVTRILLTIKYRFTLCGDSVNSFVHTFYGLQVLHA